MDSRNIIDEFDSEGAARAAAHELTRLNLDVYQAALALVYEDESGDTTSIALGADVTKLAKTRERNKIRGKRPPMPSN